jgi:hypothetical protein
MKIYNLLDNDNPGGIFADTGDPDFTLQLLTQAEQADNTWFVRPDFYSEPRRIQIGTRISIR